jgi:FtsZ-binding cell division protein ZapB
MQGETAMVHVKGVHDVHGIRVGNLTHLRDRNGRLTAKLARLDHQRELVQRQLVIWTQKQKATRHRLAQLLGEIADVERMLRKQRGAERRGRKRLSGARRDLPADRRRDGEFAFSVEY